MHKTTSGHGRDPLRQSEHDAEAVQTAANAIFLRRVPWSVRLGIVVALAAIVLVSFCLGRYHLSLTDLLVTVYRHFFDTAAINAKSDIAVFSIRLPRIVVVSLVGAALAVAGASYQGMFKNPLVSPDLLGASAGASFWKGSAVSITMFPVVPDYERFPGAGRSLTHTTGEIGSAGHWIKRILHHLFLYKAKGKAGWWLIPE